MSKNIVTNAVVISSAAAAANALAQATPTPKRPEQLIAQLRSTNEVSSAAGCETAPEYGAPAVRPLAFTMAEPNFELARRCKRALFRIVHHAGRPGAATEAEAVENKLIPLLSKPMLPVQVRRDLLWMLSELGTARAVQPISQLLAEKDLRDDARCVLVRMPCPEAAAALKHALGSAPDDFKAALADALRARGEKVEGYGSRKLVPTGQTTVTALQAKK